MNFKIFLLYYLLIIACSSCTFTKNANEDSIKKVEGFKDELQAITRKGRPSSAWPSPDRNSKIVKQVNRAYDSLGITDISLSTFSQIKDETVFKDLVAIENKLLSSWVPIKGFKPYTDIRKDSIPRLIRRCSSFDRAPQNAARTPAFRSVSSVSLNLYTFEVPIAFHIIAKKDSTGLKGDTRRRIDIQIDTLNKVYSKFNIKFILSSVDITINDKWYTSAGYYTDQKALYQMTKKLCKNPSNVMNVYSSGSKNLGEATFPWDTLTNGTHKDYVLINVNTLPNGPDTYFEGKYKEGNTLIHEVGHYLGLFHTFEGGVVDCQSELSDGCRPMGGDEVDDTPSQKICYFDGCGSCDAKPCDSCPAPGNDPIHNYMGYNPDACMNEMTKGQGERMKRTILQYRTALSRNFIQ